MTVNTSTHNHPNGGGGGGGDDESVDVQLPNLPGYRLTIPPPVSGARCEKPQTLVWRHGNPVIVPKPFTHGSNHAQTNPSTTDANLLPSPAQPTPTTTDTTTVPAWLRHSGDVLRFSAYFIEQVPLGMNPVEQWRIRRVCILHYLEDGTTQVTEPRKDASEGMYPGVIVRRSHIQCSADSSATNTNIITADALSVGGEVTIYKRRYHIVDADPFTRSFLATSGRVQGPPVPVPTDPWAVYAVERSKPSGLSRADPESPTRFAEILMGRDPGLKRLEKFLEGNTKVLRFSACWDDLMASVVVRRRFKVLYYLEDDTVEILEIKEKNDGREFHRFLARCSLPKSGGTATGTTRAHKALAVAPSDLRIGAHLDVYGRDFLIYDADAFTKGWGKSQLWWSDAECVTMEVADPAPAPVPPPRPLPPYNGFGDPEDSAHNCNRLVPVPPRRHRRRHLQQQQQQHSDEGSNKELNNTIPVVLRFPARFLNRPGLISSDKSRAFIISYFVEDETLAIYEPPVKNSGVVGGKFLERRRVYKKNTDEEWITEADLRVGGTVEIHGRVFELLSSTSL